MNNQKDNPENPLTITMDAAARLLCVSVGTIKNLIRRRQLVPVHIGRSVRIDIHDLKEMIRKMKGE